MSLLYRNPEAVKEIRDHILAMWRASVETLSDEDRARFESDHSHVMHIDASYFLRSIIDSKQVGETLVSMAWSTIELHNSSRPLLTSDRPLGFPLGLANPRAHIALPIGPYQIFIAAHDRSIFEEVRERSHSEIVRLMNRQTVSQARTYVWGVDDSQLDFVRRHMGKADDRVILTQEQKDEAIAAIRKAPKPIIPAEKPTQLSDHQRRNLAAATAAPKNYKETG